VLKQGDTVPEIQSRGYVVHQTISDGKNPVLGKVVVNFTDVCDGCREAIEKLVERIALRKPTPVAAEAAPASPESAATPTVEPEAVPAVAESESEGASQPDLTPEAVPTASVTPIGTAPKRKRGRPSRAEMEARKAAVAVQTPEYTESEPEAAPSVATEVAEAPESGDDPFPGHETFEDPDTGDVIDVHTGEVLAQRVDGKVKMVAGGQAVGADHPF
jgi:hypothetical protein